MAMSEHLHTVDYLLTIRILNELLAHRTIEGFFQSPSGVEVDWFALGQSGLSTTEQAILGIIRGISVIERCGGFPKSESIGEVIAEAVDNLR